jgi:GNAT superfamily N-acetyltransferase
MKPSDLDQVSQIDGDSFSDLLTRLYHTKTDLPPHEMEYLKFWQSAEPKGSIVEEEKGRITGFIFCHARGRSAWIGPIAVRVDAQGRGTGKRLMAAGLKYLDRAGLKLVGLDTFAQNPVSVSLYLKFGFQLVGGLLMLHAPDDSLRSLPLKKTHDSVPVTLRDLPAIARTERDATGFDRGMDFQFQLTTGLGAGFMARQGTRMLGYAFACIRRKASFIAPIHLYPRCGDPQVVVNRLVSSCAEWLSGRAEGSPLAFCRGTDLRMHKILLRAGFRMRSMCVTMHRTGDLGRGPIRTPYSIEKG